MQLCCLVKNNLKHDFKLLKKKNYIMASCSITGNVIFKNGKKIFEKQNENLADFTLSIYNYFNMNYPKFYKMDNLCKLGWLASEILLQNNFKSESYLPTEIGVVLANANASLDTDIKYFDTIKNIPSPSLFVYTLPNIVIGEICIRNNFKGENAFFIFENFDAEFMYEYVNNLLNKNLIRVCICGWIELIEEKYKAVLFLIEKEKDEAQFLFTKEYMNKIFAVA